MITPINKILSERIKEVRKKQNITQEQLAEQTKTSYKYIQRIEGNNPPDIRLSTLARIAQALNCAPSKLIS